MEAAALYVQILKEGGSTSNIFKQLNTIFSIDIILEKSLFFG
jgi:hypothetical protein